MDTLIALTIGFTLDLLLGDPPRMPHVVVGIGKTIAWLEKALRRILPASKRGELAAGAVLVLLVASLAFCVPYFALSAAARFHPNLGLALECFVCYQILATKCLRDASMRVYNELTAGSLAGARQAVGMIVGRDTAELDAAAVTRATVETVAENASDGVVAPMLYFAVGGAPLALLYKAINTMDSMLGYKNDKYLYFGRAAARLDDVANYIPARLTALFLILAALACRLDWRNAVRIHRRDHAAHTSPNAGHPEAACAGALDIRLGGDSAYGSRLVHKPSIGDPLREIETEDIRRANRLLYACASLCFVFCCAGLLLFATLSERTTPWI